MSSDNLVVTIPQGDLRGIERTSEFGQTYYGFLQIPYAKPPVGPLRFKSPEPAEGWTGIRDATKQGTVCPSLDAITGTIRQDSNEDSLFINVYTKELPQEGQNRPVMVWIHGGGFASGSGNDDMYGPDYFMTHNIVLATFNYRLGALGFLSLQNSECPGNYGLKDQRLALRWVKENISYFGGNPTNVTIFGESAGGSSAALLILSPSTKGLFEKAIAQSGSALTHLTYPRECAFLLGKRLGCDTNDDKTLLEFLSNASAKDIVENSEKILDEIQGVHPGEDTLSFAFVPATEPESDDAFLTKDPLVLLSEGGYSDVPSLFGNCSKEMYLALKGPDDFPRWTEDPQFQALIPRQLKLEEDTELSFQVAKKIREFYFKDGVNVQNYVDVLSANFFTYGVYTTVKHFVTNKERKSPSYLYRFSYDGGRAYLKAFLGLQDLRGTCHSEEIAYQFKPSIIPLPPLEPGTSDYVVSNNLVKLWVYFATYGQPEWEAWTPADPEKMSFMEIGADLELKEGFFREEMEFWDEIYKLVQG